MFEMQKSVRGIGGTLVTIAMAGLALTASAASGNAPRVGADRDQHGCIASAGYTYSVIRKNCIRLFESGIRLEPVKQSGSQVASAFVVFKGESGVGNAELFLPEIKGSIILKKVPGENAGLWKSRAYKLSQWKGMYMIDTVKGKALYQGPEV